MGEIIVESSDDIEETQAAVDSSEKESEESESAEEVDEKEESQSDDDQDEGEEEESDEEESEEDDSDDDDEEEDDSDDEEDKGKKKPKRGNRVGKRISKLVKQRNQQAQQIEELRREIESMRGQKSGENPQKEAGSIDGLKEPNIDDFDDWDSYNDAILDYKLEKRLVAEKAKQEEAKQKAELVSRSEKLRADMDKLANEIEDYEEVLQEVDDVMTSANLGRALLESENGALIAYELAKNPDEFRRINKLSALEVGKAIGKIEAKLELSKNPHASKKAVKKKTKAPKPLEKVRTKGQGTVKSLEDDSLSQKEWEALRNKQIKERKSKGYY